MAGLMYKNLLLYRMELIVIGVLQLFISTTVLLTGITDSGSPEGTLLLYGCMFLIIGYIESGECYGTQGQKIPCVSMCPAHVDIPGYIAHVADGNYDKAINLIRRDNPLPTTCAMICEHPCEERCRRTLIDAPLNIRGIKKFAAAYAPITVIGE